MLLEELSEDNQFLKSKEEIDEWMSLQDCKEYTISDDLIVDIASDFELKSNIKQFPVNFGECNGNFWCNNNSLTSLSGAPREVGGNFDARNNKFTEEPDHSFINIEGEFKWK